MEENKKCIRHKVKLEPIKQPQPDISPEREDFASESFLTFTLFDSISKLQEKNKKDQGVILNQIIDQLLQKKYENALTITSMMTERKNLVKLYQKHKYRQYQNELDSAIKMSLTEHGSHHQDFTYENLLLLQEQIGFVNVGLSDEEIKAIGICTLDEPDICSICLNHGDSGKVLLCSHFFHTECIDKWLKEKKSCPLCLSDAIVR